MIISSRNKRSAIPYLPSYRWMDAFYIRVVLFMFVTVAAAAAADDDDVEVLNSKRN